MKISRIFWVLPATLLLALLATPLIARAANPFTQSYPTDTSLSLGSLVSLAKGSNEKVEAANSDNNKNLLGVVVDASNSSISVSSKDKTQVQVATSGVEGVLVSDINGNIVVGDSITTSPISGLGMKATGNSKIVGVAQDSFPNSTAVRKTYKDKSGKEQSVMAGQVTVQVNVAYYYKEPEKSLIPQAIQNVANTVAGKKVNAIPILISLGIFIVTMIIVTVIVYSMIRSSIISVGRNPMSQSAVYRNVMQISALVVVILLVAVGSIYMVITKF